MYFLYSFVIAFFSLACPVYAAEFAREDDVIGKVTHYRVHKGDTLYEIARYHDIGIVELLAANPGVDPWMPETGKELTITSMHVLPPAPREGIVINLSELRLFYYLEDGKVMSFPIGIGREGWQTPLGATKILRKRENPIWTPPPSIRKENPDLPETFPPGPDNPLGQYALDLGLPGILIHGTNRPYGVGKRSSHGCIRLYPEDIATLFTWVEKGTPVNIIDTPFKLGWKGDTLFLEITPTQQQADSIAEYGMPSAISMPEIYDIIWNFTEADIDWYAMEEAIGQYRGIPVAVGKRPGR